MNNSNLAFGEVDRYCGELDDERNTAGVRCERKTHRGHSSNNIYTEKLIHTCTGYETDDCSYLDVRLTFRTAISSGLVEICNEERNWSIACSNAFSENEATIICRQLDFNHRYINSFTDSVPLILNEQKPRTGEVPRCKGIETSLAECQFSNQARKRRGVENTEPNACNFQAGLQCGGIR